MSFVVHKENNFGIGKLLERDESSETIEYFDSPTALESKRITVPAGSTGPVTLPPQTRVYFLDRDSGFWRIGRIDNHVSGIGYISLPNKQTTAQSDGQLYTRWDFPIRRPLDHLAAQVTETPFYHAARAELVQHFIQQRAVSSGMTALLSAPIDLEPYQVEVIRRVLQDPVQRYMLADEVGLGKTIEAGIIVRQHLLDYPQEHRVLIVVPAALVDQWRTELARRCNVEAARYSHRVEIVALEELTNWHGISPNFVVVDEAHQAAHGWRESVDSSVRAHFEKLRYLTDPARCPKLLLLTATPVRHNEHGFLALLHLLDPMMYPINDVAGFQAKVAKRQELADLLAGFTEDQTPYFLEDMAGQLGALFPADAHLKHLLAQVCRHTDYNVETDESALREAVRTVRLHVGETYRLHRRLLRNRRIESLADRLPGRDGLGTADWNDEGIVEAERLLETWRLKAAAVLWDHPDDSWRQATAEVFRILLEAAWADCEALAACVESRLERRVRTQATRFGLLTAPDRLRVLVETPLFDGEESILRELSDKREGFREWQRLRVKTWCTLLGKLRARNLRVVCMATSPALADELFDALRAAQGAAVARHQLAGNTWHTAWATGAATILVCDNRAEEGLNLQGGAACLVHVDLPLSPNRLEQRIGRLDRFGAGRRVKSYAMQMNQCSFWFAWVRCLDDAWQVFDRSVATLQYLVEDEMRALAKKMLLEGAAAIHDAGVRLGGKEGSLAREFTAIYNQDALDALETSAGPDSAENLVTRIEEYEQQGYTFGQAVERWMVNGLQFWRMIVPGPPGPAVLNQEQIVRYHYRDADHGRRTLVSKRELVRWFRPSIEVGARMPEISGPLTHAVAYQRETARHRGVSLGRLGNPVIDCLHDYLCWDDRGISFAMWRLDPRVASDTVPRVYFRFDFIVEANLEPLLATFHTKSAADRNALSRRADGAFPPIGETVWINQDLMVPEEMFTIATLKRPFVKGADQNINQQLWPRVMELLGPCQWRELCIDAERAAQDWLHRRHALADLTLRQAEAFMKVAATAREQRASRLATFIEGTSEWIRLREEIEDTQQNDAAIADGVRRPQIRLDAAGVVILAGGALA